jgi:hypothetical protein
MINPHHYLRRPPPCGLRAHRETRICQNITPNTTIQLKFDHIPTPTHTINERLTQANTPYWKTQPTNALHKLPSTGQATLRIPQHIALPKLISNPNSHSFRLKHGIPGPCLMHYTETLIEPNATIHEILMGLQPGTTAAPGLSET